MQWRLTGVQLWMALLLIWCNASLHVNAQTRLVLSGAKDPLSEISALVLQEAYKRIGIEVETAWQPAERSLKSSNAGQVDGELNRIAGLESQYPNLVRVPIPVNLLEGVVFSKNVTPVISGISSIRGFQIAIRRGTKFAERLTQGMEPLMLSKNIQLFRVLNAGRVDLIITSHLEGLEMLNQLKFRQIQVLKPPLVSLDLYHYLHKKHQALVKPLSTTLLNMQVEGEIVRIRQQFMDARYQ